MKLRNFTLALATAALLSTIVYASDNTDTAGSGLEQVRNSGNYMLAAMTANDPFVVALTPAGWDKADKLNYQP